MVIVIIIPFSLKISDLIYEVNKSTVEQATANVSSLEGEASKSWIDELVDKISDGIADAKENAKRILNGFIDAIALFIITYCAIPVIVVFLVIWFIRFLFGITIPKFRKPKIQLLAKEQTKELIEIK